MKRLATLALVVFVLAACSKPQADERELNLFAWSEYVPQTIIDGFTAETGIRVNYESYASNEEMLAKLVSGAQRYDLVQPSDYIVEALAREKHLQPLDHSKLPNLGNIDPELLQLPHDPGLKFSVPWMVGTVGIVVNSERVPEEVRGYQDLFQEKYRGRIVIVDDAREIVAWALACVGKGANEVNEATLAQVEPLIARWLPLVKLYDSDSPKTALLNGDVDLGVVWSGEAALLYAEDKKFRYVLPAEGAHRFIDSLAIPAHAVHVDAAHAFLAYILRPEVSQRISAHFPYTNPNVAARQLLSPEQLANPASYPPGNPKLEGFRDIGDAAVLVDKLITDLKARG